MTKKMIAAALALAAMCATVAAAQQKEADFTEQDKPPVELRVDDGTLADEIVIRSVELGTEIEAPVTVGYEPPAYAD